MKSTFDKLKGEIVLMYDTTNQMIKKVLINSHTQHRVRISPVVGNDISDVQIGFRKRDIVLIPDDQECYDSILKGIKAVATVQKNLDDYVNTVKYEVNE